MPAPEVFISAGDPSGDNAASRVLKELKRIIPGLTCFGLGGQRLAAEGQRQLVDGSSLAVLGFWEVARRFFFFKRLMARCVEQIADRRPDAVVLVDYPGFNLRLAERIKPLGIPVIYYISPQVWAWGKRRLSKMKELVDLMLYILPFEQATFEQARMPAKFVGHYLLEDIPAEYLAADSPKANRLALLPGSRSQEVQRHLAPMLEAARIFCRRNDWKADLAAIRGVYDYESALHPGDVEFLLITYDDPRRVIHDSSLVLTASGTATLETALIARPMLVVYKTGWLTYQIARRLIDLDHIALANLVQGHPVVPELIQSDVTGASMADSLQKLRDDPKARMQMIDTLKQTRSLLGESGSSRRAAEAIARILSGEGAAC